MNETILKNGKIVKWRDDLISSQGIRVTVKTKLGKDEKMEFKRIVKSERDVVCFYFEANI